MHQHASNSGGTEHEVAQSHAGLGIQAVADYPRNSSSTLLALEMSGDSENSVVGYQLVFRVVVDRLGSVDPRLPQAAEGEDGDA